MAWRINSDIFRTHSTSEDQVELQKRKESIEKTKLRLLFLDDRRTGMFSFGTLIFKHVYFDTVMKVKREVGNYQETTLPALRTEECAKSSKITWTENSRVSIGRVAFTAEASNL